MKKFILKGVVFSAIILGICAYVIKMSMVEPSRTAIAKWTNCEDFMADSGMLPYFEQARNADGTTQLIIGDSICRQMFVDLKQHNPQVSIQATNAALMITGQYILAEEYLNCHPDATDVFLIMHPMPLTRTFDLEWSYRYAVMTYAETDTLELLDQNTIDSMTSVYGPLLMQKNIIRMIEDSPILRKLCLSYINLNCSAYVQKSPFEIADQYVKKLYDLCQERHVALHLYPAPVSESFREQVSALAGEYGSTWMSGVYPDFFEDILYYPNEWSEDLSHFSGEHASREALNETIRKAYANTALLDSLLLEGDDSP